MKYCGQIGYSQTVETSPGVWTETITERTYYGDVIRNNRRLQDSNQVNDNVTISNEISVIADPYACHNFHMIRYLTFMGIKWKVSSVDVQYPRLILTIGGLYNEQET